MQYEQAVRTVTNPEMIAGFFLVVIALLVLFLLVGQGIKMWKDLFSKPKQEEDDQYTEHCRSSEKRFKTIEQANKENSAYIEDLREGQKVLCVACMAMLNHDLHNGNSDEMQKALGQLNGYLINRP